MAEKPVVVKDTPKGVVMSPEDLALLKANPVVKGQRPIETKDVVLTQKQASNIEEPVEVEVAPWEEKSEGWRYQKQYINEIKRNVQPVEVVGGLTNVRLVSQTSSAPVELKAAV